MQTQLREPVKSQVAADLKNSFVKLTEKLITRGCKPSTFILDIEISNELKAAIKKYDIAYQLAPSAQHGRNTAERAIWIFKNHFLARLASLHDSFPMRKWDRLIKQSILTINLLQNLRLNPKN